MPSIALALNCPKRTAVNRRPKWTVSETDTKNWNVHNYPRVDPVPHNHRSTIYDGRAAHDFVTCSKAPLTKILLTTIWGSGATRVRRTIWASCGKLANCCRDCRCTLRLICLPARRG